MILDIFLLIIGFVVLIKGADFFVDGASSIADNFKVPKILIGLTIVAFGTSAPELAVSIKAIISNNHDLILGNVIGSNILNVLLILGIAALFKPLIVKNNTIKKEIPIMLMITCLFGVLLSDSLFDSKIVNNFTRSDGIVLLLFFLVFVYYLSDITVNKEMVMKDKIKKLSLPKAIIYTILGITMVVIGGELVVNYASIIAENVGVSKRMIGLTVIALGTSLPELVTSITAARKGESDLAIGNIVGSCILNIGIVMALPVAIFGGIEKISFSNLDIVVMIISVLILFFFSLTDRKITKKEGILFLILFIAYYSIVIING
jgi:cation:H+ antiporter